MACAKLSAILHWPALCFVLFSLIAFKYAKGWLISRNLELKNCANPFLTHLLGLPSRQHWHSSDCGSLYSEDTIEARAGSLYVLYVYEAAVRDWEEINFFNVAFQHFKHMYGSFSFDGMIALKLIKRVVSKFMPEIFGHPLLNAHLLFPSAAR